MPRRTNSASAVVGLGFICLFALCCGGPCALLSRSPRESGVTQNATTPVVEPKRSLPPVNLPSKSPTSQPVTAATNSNAASQTQLVQAPPKQQTVTDRSQIAPRPVSPSGISSTPSSDSQNNVNSTTPIRQWTSRAGGFRTSARFIGFIDGAARLSKESGGGISVPLEKLSAPDCQYVKNILRVDANARVITGKIVGVTDGDTVTVLDEENQQHKIRLEGIDAPESGQDFGTAAKQQLSSKIFDKFPWIEWRESDKYGRILGHIYLDGRHINLEMVADGYAWHYKEYSNDPRLANAETVARKKRIGLWTDPSPVAPWDFRHGDKSSATSRPSVSPINSVKAAATAEADTMVYITATGEKYHRGTCRHLSKSRIPIDLSEARGKYSPCTTCSPPK